MNKAPESPLVIFDGHCNFCNASVNFIMTRDTQKVFLFTPNQENSGQKILQNHHIPGSDVDTLYLYEDEQLYDRSTAALRIARHLTFPWNLSYLFIIIPRFIRDSLYDIIARNRYKWFGKSETCHLPTEEERARFI